MLIAYEDVKDLRQGDRIHLKIRNEDGFSFSGMEIDAVFDRLSICFEDPLVDGYNFNWRMHVQMDPSVFDDQLPSREADVDFHLGILEEVRVMYDHTDA
jgi:hypothetical protein